MRTSVVTTDAPNPIGPYSQAIKAGGFVFLAGQIPLDPSTGQLVAGGIVPQTERVLRNVVGLLEAAGSRMENVVRCMVFLKSMSDFAAMNETYARYFTAEPPVRSAVEVARLPKDCLIEIEVTALA